MNCWILLLLSSTAMQGAVLRGTVVSFDGGEPLSQTVVTLRALTGGGGGGGTAKTNRFGIFEFVGLADGNYIVSASRPNWIPAICGQKRWNSAGYPVLVNEREAPTIVIRMHRYGAITGRIADENDVGILNHDVLAYRDSLPLQVIAKATTDDYGRYRIYGLLPGRYLIRSAAKTVDGVGYLPTYAPATQELNQAKRVDVQVDVESPGMDVHPDQGRLFSVTAFTPFAGNCGPMAITLAGEAGREVKPPSDSPDGPFVRFAPVAPGQYELYGRGICDSQQDQPAGGYTKVIVDDDKTFRLPLAGVRPMRVYYGMDTGGMVPRDVKLSLDVRPRDLAGVGDSKSFNPAPRELPLAPGRWELLLKPDSKYAVVGFSAPVPSGNDLASRAHPDDWNELLAPGNFRDISFTLSTGMSQMRGLVTGASREPVVGAPVFLEVYDTNLRQRIAGPRVAYTDNQGLYQFDALPPGTYRVLATFEYATPDQQAMDDSQAKLIRIAKNDTLSQDLDLFILH